MVGFQSAATSDWLGEEATFGGGSKFNDQNSNLSSAKLRWRMLKSPDQLWDKVLWMKYGDPLALVPKRGNISQIWRGIQAARGVRGTKFRPLTVVLPIERIMKKAIRIESDAADLDARNALLPRLGKRKKQQYEHFPMALPV
ncbi:hypothetical protein M9H77_06123 [Catharanthus roseus]|uniref:Uncharacterized protein n=1 Tax=Catharanthus roseus TaxID=4058 RepID=A0ACC0BR85_CATRO|nr:hypothetical protein M9H77_06123 [Catharanthus roseus]